MCTDGLAPSVPRNSADMLLTRNSQQSLNFQEDELQILGDHCNKEKLPYYYTNSN